LLYETFCIYLKQYTLKNSFSLRPCFITLLWCIAFPLLLNAQNEKQVIVLKNPSFEEPSRAGIVGGKGPQGWQDCSIPDESAPDIQPGFFEVTKAAKHGYTYLGMVVRDNDTWEAISQRLSRPLEVNKRYEMTLDLCNSDEYISQSRTTGQRVNYSVPVKLRFYGGNDDCARQELLYETPMIMNKDWLTFRITLRPKKANYNYLLMEAYYQTPLIFPYNGNILIDNLSPIQIIGGKPPELTIKYPQVYKLQSIQAIEPYTYRKVGGISFEEVETDPSTKQELKSYGEPMLQSIREIRLLDDSKLLLVVANSNSSGDTLREFEVPYWWDESQLIIEDNTFSSEGWGSVLVFSKDLKEIVGHSRIYILKYNDTFLSRRNYKPLKVLELAISDDYIVNLKDIAKTASATKAMRPKDTVTLALVKVVYRLE
jgi:hypothetical protein